MGSGRERKWTRASTQTRSRKQPLRRHGNTQVGLRDRPLSALASRCMQLSALKWQGCGTARPRDQPSAARGDHSERFSRCPLRTCESIGHGVLHGHGASNGNDHGPLLTVHSHQEGRGAHAAHPHASKQRGVSRKMHLETHCPHANTSNPCRGNHVHAAPTPVTLQFEFGSGHIRVDVGCEQQVLTVRDGLDPQSTLERHTYARAQNPHHSRWVTRLPAKKGTTGNARQRCIRRRETTTCPRTSLHTHVSPTTPGWEPQGPSQYLGRGCV